MGVTVLAGEILRQNQRDVALVENGLLVRVGLDVGVFVALFEAALLAVQREGDDVALLH